MNTITKDALLRQLGAIKKVRNLVSPRSGREVANQFELICENGTAFQSYGTLIAVRIYGRGRRILYLTDSHDYSKTTSKYTSEWTGYDTKSRREGLKDGSITLILD